MTDLRHVGITATRRGATPTQLYTLRLHLDTGVPEFCMHHGDCVGGDEQAHKLGLEMLSVASFVVHPPINERNRAFCQSPVKPIEWRLPNEYLVRDREMVDEVDLLFALPHNYRYLPRGSGTWYTWNYGQKRFRKSIVIYPDGTTK